MRLCLIFAFLTSCAAQSDGEICDLAKVCFEKKQGITIIFEPQPETKEAQNVEKH